MATLSDNRNHDRFHGAGDQPDQTEDGDYPRNDLAAERCSDAASNGRGVDRRQRTTRSRQARSVGGSASCSAGTSTGRVLSAAARTVRSGFLADECRRIGRGAATAVITCHARGRSRARMRAGGGCGLRSRRAPHRAGQRGARPSGEHRREGEDSCSKHVKLAHRKARCGPAGAAAARRNIRGSSPELPGEARGCGFPGGAENPAAVTRASRATADGTAGAPPHC